MDAACNGWAVERLEERLSGERDGELTGFGQLDDAVGWVYSGRLPKRTYVARLRRISGDVPANLMIDCLAWSIIWRAPERVKMWSGL